MSSPSDETSPLLGRRFAVGRDASCSSLEEDPAPIAPSPNERRKNTIGTLFLHAGQSDVEFYFVCYEYGSRGFITILSLPICSVHIGGVPTEHVVQSDIQPPWHCVIRRQYPRIIRISSSGAIQVAVYQGADAFVSNIHGRGTCIYYRRIDWQGEA